MSRDAFGARNVDEGVIAGGMSFLGNRVNGSQFFRGIDKTFETAGDIVVHFDAENVGVGGPADNLIRFIHTQSVTGNTHVVRPVLIGLASQEAKAPEENAESSQHFGREKQYKTIQPTVYRNFHITLFAFVFGPHGKKSQLTSASDWAYAEVDSKPATI